MGMGEAAMEGIRLGNTINECNINIIQHLYNISNFTKIVHNFEIVKNHDELI